MSEIIEIETWTCRTPGCLSKADGIGRTTGLLCIGWYVSIKPDGDYVLYCPNCHPSGIQAAKDVAGWIHAKVVVALKVEDTRIKEKP